MSHSVNSLCALPASASSAKASTYIISNALYNLLPPPHLRQPRPQLRSLIHQPTQQPPAYPTWPSRPQPPLRPRRSSLKPCVPCVPTRCRASETSAAALAIAPRSARGTTGLSTSFFASPTRTLLSRLRQTNSAPSSFRTMRTSRASSGSRSSMVTFRTWIVWPSFFASIPFHCGTAPLAHRNLCTTRFSTPC
jgi:hypothetical protein